MKKFALLAATIALGVQAGPALSQASSGQARQNPLGTLLGAILGGGAGATSSIDAQWAAGRTPLNNQRAQFESKVDLEVRAGNISTTDGQRLKSDYYALAQLEGRYSSDGRFTAQERADLTSRYGALTQQLANGGYANNGYQYNDDANDGYTTSQAATGRAEFERRVDTAVSSRRLTRVQGTRLKSDYAATVQLEANYMRDGSLSASEREELNTRLDALDARIGDVSYGAVSVTPRARLTAIGGAVPSSGLSSVAQSQIRTEVEDLSRLEAAYARLTVSAEERAYLDRRVDDLEARVRLRR